MLTWNPDCKMERLGKTNDWKKNPPSLKDDKMEKGIYFTSAPFIKHKLYAVYLKIALQILMLSSEDSILSTSVQLETQCTWYLLKIALQALVFSLSSIWCMLSTEDSTASTSFYLKALSSCYLLKTALQALVFSLKPNKYVICWR